LTWREAASQGVRALARRLSRSKQNRELIDLLQRVIARQREEMTAQREAQSFLERRITSLSRQLTAQRKEDLRARAVFRSQLNALVRKEAIRDTDITQPYSLNAHRFRLRSQNEEDGVTLELLKNAGITNRRFVEIGSGSSGGNSAVLAFEFGWHGLMIEAGKGKVETLQRALAFNPGVTVVRHFVTPETINQILERYGCTGDVDFMSIDIDSADYWLLDALRVCSPRVLVMEYNALFGPDRSLTLPSTGLPDRLPKGYFGASLTAIEKKAREKGFRLVYCDESGVNAFFLRDGVAPDVRGLTPSAAYRPWRERLAVDGTKKDIDVFALMEAHALPIVEV
jgi:hypothetical protein